MLQEDHPWLYAPLEPSKVCGGRDSELPNSHWLQLESTTYPPINWPQSRICGKPDLTQHTTARFPPESLQVQLLTALTVITSYL